MISFETFLFGLMATSTVTGLVTEAVKKLLTEHKVTYYSNTLTAIVAVFVSAAIGSGYMVMNTIPFTVKTIVALIALTGLSWVCAMVGYDKTVQTIIQLKTNRKG